MEIYEKIAKVVSAIIAICCMICMWNFAETYKQSQRYPIKEEEYISLENYALETAKNLDEEEINISKEEIARRKNDNYKVVERRYAKEKFFVKVESDIAEVEATIPASIIEKGTDANTVDFKMILKYDEVTYTRRDTVYPVIVYIAMYACITVLLGIMFYFILDFIGIAVVVIIGVIQWIVRKIKKQ